MPLSSCLGKQCIRDITEFQWLYQKFCGRLIELLNFAGIKKKYDHSNFLNSVLHCMHARCFSHNRPAVALPEGQFTSMLSVLKTWRKYYLAHSLFLTWHQCKFLTRLTECTFLLLTALLFIIVNTVSEFASLPSPLIGSVAELSTIRTRAPNRRFIMFPPLD